MDKSVRRVTAVQANGDHRESKIVHEDTDDEVEEHPRFRPARSVRHMLKTPLPLPPLPLLPLPPLPLVVAMVALAVV
jgi:hypothetical protein